MKRILIVDDNPDLRYTVKEGLEEAGCNYTYLEAENGKEALEILKENKVDLVLLDIMMPEMDGWDVAAEIKMNEETKNLPILFLTAKTDNLSKGMGLVTAEDYIEKPFEIEYLKERLAAALRK